MSLAPAWARLYVNQFVPTDVSKTAMRSLAV